MSNETIERYISQKARDAMPASDFAGHGTDFPIPDQTHLDAAVKDMGRETPEYQTFIKKNIIRIAKEKGLSLPKSWQEDGKTEERMAGTTEQPTTFNLYVPFTRVSPDDDRREIIGIATKEVLDNHGTIISYEASKKAFARWGGNIREQHDIKKAVGHALEWTPDDENKQIIVRAFISKGAQDTWEKIKDGTLTGFSIAGTDAKYKTIQRDSKTIPFIDEYKMPELSIVDNPSCPVGPVAIVRAEGMTDVLATDTEMSELAKAAQSPTAKETPTTTQPTEIERKSVAISADNRDKIHASRDALTSMCAGAGCTDCQAMMDFAGGGSDIGDEDANSAAMADVEERVAGIVTSAMAPVYARMQAMLGQFSRAQQDTSTIQDATTALSSAFAELRSEVGAFARAEHLDKVAAKLELLEGQIERIAKTPLPGGPHTGRISNGKTLATDGPASTADSAAHTPEIMRQLAQSGVTLTPQQSAMLVANNLKRL